MSLHEKERNKKMPTPRHKVTHNPIPTSLFLPRLHKSTCALRKQKDAPKERIKNHFYEMKGDVGMSLHEKERKTQSHS